MDKNNLKEIVVDTEGRSTEVIPEDALFNFIRIDSHKGFAGVDVEGSGILSMLEVRAGGPLSGKAFYLNDSVSWALGVDKYGVMVLVPYRKCQKKEEE